MHSSTIHRHINVLSCATLPVSPLPNNSSTYTSSRPTNYSSSTTMSPLATWVFAVLASSALAAPSQMSKRADTNTNTNIHLICGSQDIPSKKNTLLYSFGAHAHEYVKDPVAGTGTGSASDQLYISAQGQKGSGQNCSQDPNDGNLNTCTFPASYGFKSDIVVRVSPTSWGMLKH